MRAAILALAFGLAACGEKPAPAPSLGPSASAPPGAALSPLSSPVAGASCAAGDRLPVTGVCTDAQPALFGYVNANAEKERPDCTWITAEARRSETEALVFRVLKCPKGAAMLGWKFDGPQKLVSIYTPPGPGQAPSETTAAEIWDLPAGQTAQAKALEMLSEAPANEKGRCVIKATPENKAAAGETFLLAPNGALMKELEKRAKGDLIEACGRHGFTQDFVAFWEARPGYAIFHDLGQDVPGWDPASFTFYHKGADGVWRKAS
jgi:hypothetical protein